MSAPNLKEIEWAISELEKGESSFPVYAKLANLYTVRDKMMKHSVQQSQVSPYSEVEPMPETIGRYGDSGFLKSVAGKNPAKVWTIIDDFMDSLRVVNRRAYDNLIRRLDGV